MVDRPTVAMAGVARFAWAAVLVIGVLSLAALLTATSRCRSGLRSLYARSHDERGAISLVEMVVVMALATVMLMAIASVAMVSERSAALASSNFGAARRANTALVSAMNAISDASPIEGCTETAQGVQLSGDPAVYSQPLSNCAQMAPQTAAIATFADSTNGSQGPCWYSFICLQSPANGSQGLCWYSYPGSGAGLVAPDLRCLVAYQDGTIWSFDWPPLPGATYTSCDPSSCFGTSAPQPGALPPEPNASTGSTATFAGRTQAAHPFTFLTSDGKQASTAGSIYEVEVNVVEDYWGTKSEDFSQSYTEDAYVGSAVQGDNQSWQSI
jgi:type II secretory pathway pseudopilin PulG